MGDVAKIRSVEPLRTSDFGAGQHKIMSFNAVVDGALTKEDLESPAFWVNVAKHFEVSSTEVRMVAEDMSFVAYGICTYAQGSTAKIKITSWYDLDEVDRKEVVDPLDDYVIENKGAKKWCIIRKSTGEFITQDIDTQAKAVKELSDYKKVLSR